jgi:hydroxycarboxylate dehydrogenase B
MPAIPSARLHDLVVLVAGAMGSGEAEARDVADHLVAANLAGHDSHGVGMIPDYVRMRQAGLLVPNQALEPVADRGGVLVFDARRGFGQAMAKEAMRRGIERAKAQGSVVVALRNSSHVGRVGHWAEQCAAVGMVSVHFVNVGDHDPLQAPYGCSDARLGTNPFAVGVPGSGGGLLLLLDMATSAIAFGKARVARNKGVPVPPDTVIDKQGRVTTDPTALVDLREGALKAFGAHKGSGLAIMCEMLGGALTGGLTMQPEHEQHHGIVNSMLSILIDPASMGDPAAIRHEVEAIGQWIKASPPAEGFEEILLPGDPERRAKAARQAEGIPLDDKSLADILAAAESLGLLRSRLDQTLGR